MLDDRRSVNHDLRHRTSTDDEFDTIGGLVAHEHGQVPRRGETVDIGGLAFQVMLTRGGAVRWFKVSRRAAPEDGHSN
jgi:magnesium and cobalt transporter